MTVVVAAVEAERALPRCLDALAIARAGRRIEIIVVGPDETRAQLSSHRDVEFLPIERQALAPQMWSEGITNASAPIVALTTAHCFVSPGWCDAFLANLKSQSAAACGGPFRLAPGANTVDAAVFFLRYSAYLEGMKRNPVQNIAGDNAAYVVSQIPVATWDRSAGFWEHDVNRAIVESGQTIAWSDAAVVDFGFSFSPGAICRQRFEHGRLFGIARVSRNESRMKIVAAFLLVPFVLALRAWRNVALIKSCRGPFLLALPLMLVIGFCWAAGEAVGAVEASR